MICPNCRHEKSRVVDSRLRDETKHRRRECFKCKHRWSTYEFPFPSFDDQEQEFDNPLKLMNELAGLQHRWRMVAYEVIRGLRARQTMFDLNRRES